MACMLSTCAIHLFRFDFVSRMLRSGNIINVQMHPTATFSKATPSSAQHMLHEPGRYQNGGGCP